MLKEYNGIYRGKIVNNGSFNDWRAGAGKVQVWVPGVHPTEFLQPDKQSMLPWAEPAMPIDLGVGSVGGTYSVPENNTVVWVFFEGGDHMRPVYFAVTPNAKAWATDLTSQHVRVIGQSTFSLTVDESYLIDQQKKFELDYETLKPLTVSNENSSAPAGQAEENAAANEMTLPGVVVNITRAEGGMANVTVFINGMLNIVSIGGGTFNGLPIL